MKRHNMRFALPGAIALFIVAVIHDLLPPFVRFFAYASVLVTLMLGLATGQFRKMGLEARKAKAANDTKHTLNNRQLYVVLFGIAPVTTLAALSCRSDRSYCKIAFLAVLAGGLIAIYVLRDRGGDSEDASPADAETE